MEQHRTHFFSDGLRLEATVYRPDEPSGEGPFPTVIVNSGYQGFNEFYPRMFAEALTARGYVCIGFDYRGFADSQGETGRVIIEEQVCDVRHAIAFARARDEVDDERLVLLGWGMGAANAVLAAERSRCVAAVVALNGFYDGERWLRSIHTYDEWTHVLEEVEADRRRRSTTGESRLAETFAHYPLDPSTASYVSAELEKVPGFGHPTRVQFTESVLDLKVERAVPYLDAPLFVGHGLANTLHPFAEAEALYAAAPSPKRLYTIAGRHNDFMYAAHPVFVDLVERIDEFLVEALAPKVLVGSMRSE